MKPIIVALLICVSAIFPPASNAQTAPWPSHAIRLIVPGGTGGVFDTRARWLAERLSPALGQPVVVENKPGAGGNIGMAYAAHSPADGHTLVAVHPGVMTVNPHLYARLGYDPLVDFTPVTRVGYGPLLLAVSADVPARTVGELIQLAKAQPGRLSFGSNGIGTPPHLAGELFKRMAGIDITHVPYHGGGQTVSDLIAGHITMSIEGVTSQLPHVKSGRIRALAVTGARRLSFLPDVPTVAEAGVPGYEFTGWVGLAVPAGVPRPVLDRLYAEVAKILNSPEGREWFAANGAEPGAEPPDVFAAVIRAEHAKWGKLVRDAGIKAE